MSFSVSSEKGGRIISFKRGNRELLATDIVHPLYYGSTLWLSPQSDYWPQYPNVDNLPYRAEIQNDLLRLISQSDSVSGIHIIKEFSLSEKDTSVLITYTIENISGQRKKLAPWDVTRVFGGLSFFPVGENIEINKSDVEGAYEKNGIMWYPFTNGLNEKGQKLFSTAHGGWLAHYYNHLLFVKCFPDIIPDEMPLGQGEAEIYVAPKGIYLELENHGKYTELLPRQSIQYKQKWFLLETESKAEQELLHVIGQLDKKTD
jgi:hypothetical protein